MRILRFLPILLLPTVAAMANTTPVIDGIFNTAEWGTRVLHVSPYVNGTSGAQQSVDLYWATDSQRVYGAVVGDPNLPSAFGAANIYVYSSGASTKPGGAKGIYGDGDDVLIQSGNRWNFALNGFPWVDGNDHNLVMNSDITGKLKSGSDANVSYAYDSSKLVTEFSIDRGILGDYDQFRYGGQLYAYEFNTGGDRENGALVPAFAAVPEPSSYAAILGIGLVGLALVRRRSKQ